MNKKELLKAYAAGRRDFTGVDLSGADLRGAVLSRADLFGADLSCAKLSSANLYGAILNGANLTGTDLRSADLSCANLIDATLSGADLTGADLSEAWLQGVDLTGAVGFRFPGSPDPLELRQRVADQIREHPELHDQGAWGYRGDDESCGTPCCVAGWACRLGGGPRGHRISTAATVLLHCDGYRVPSFVGSASRESIIRDLTVPIKEQK